MADQTPTQGMPAFGLAVPTNLLVLAYQPLVRQFLTASPAMSDDARRVEQERQERLTRELAAAQDEWRQYFDRHYANRVAHAAFDIHQPEAGYDTVVCSECEEHNGYEDTRQVEWPCNTYAAMKGAADG